MARISENGLYDDIEYTTSKPGQLTLITPDPGFRVEYYTPYDLDGDRRSYTFQWQSELTVDEFLPLIQEPILADKLTIDRRVIDSSTKTDGLLYHELYPSPVAPGETYALNISYSLESDELSADAMINGVFQPAPAVEILKENLENGWIRYELPGYGFAIALPPGWLFYDTATDLDDDVMKKAGENNSDLFGPFSGLDLSDLTRQGLIFMAFDFTAEVPPNSSPPGMNVMVQERNLDPTDTTINLPLEQLEIQLNLGKPIEHLRVEIDGIPAEKIRYEMELVGFGGPMPMENTQYFLNLDGNLVTITFATYAELGDEYEEIFKKIVQSVEWPDHD